MFTKTIYKFICNTGKKDQTVKLALDCKNIIHKIKYQTLSVILTWGNAKHACLDWNNLMNPSLPTIVMHE